MGKELNWKGPLVPSVPVPLNWYPVEFCGVGMGIINYFF